VSGFAQAYGEEIYDGEADELGVNTDAVAKGLRLVVEDLKQFMPNDPGYGPQASVFKDGNAAFHINGPWELSNINEAGINFGVAPLPDLPDDGTARPYMGVKLVYFATKMDADGEADNAQAAREYAEWFTTKDTRLLNLANQGGFVPVRIGLAGNENLPDNVKAYAQQVATGFPMPQNTKMNQVWGPFGDAVQNAFNNPGNLESALEAAEQAIRNNWESN
jgi:arabinogalactan oligomer/maltooligosaccharide transport system substrate-binding protein